MANQETTVSRDELLGRIAKAFVAQRLAIDPQAWPLTHDRAWVSLAARLLNAPGSTLARRPLKSRLATPLAHQYVNGGSSK